MNVTEREFANVKLVYNGIGQAVTEIPAADGVYIVKAGGVVRKLVVGSRR